MLKNVSPSSKVKHRIKLTKLFLSRAFQTFAQCDHVIDDVSIVRDHARLKALDRQREDVGDYQRLGRGRIRPAVDEAPKDTASP